MIERHLSLPYTFLQISSYVAEQSPKKHVWCPRNSSVSSQHSFYFYLHNKSVPFFFSPFFCHFKIPISLLTLITQITYSLSIMALPTTDTPRIATNIVFLAITHTSTTKIYTSYSCSIRSPVGRRKIVIRLHIAKRMSVG